MAARRTHPNPWLVLAKLVGVLLVTGVLAAGVLLPYVGGIGLAAKHEADTFLSKKCTLQETPPPQKTEVYANDGKTLIATIFKQDRQPIPLSQVPKTLQQALIATEDRRFYSHHGVDVRGLLRSALNTSSGDTQGGSTLTMQYVKQMRYYQASSIQDPAKQKAAENAAIAQTLDRKMEDAKCALYIENTLHRSKDTILDNYLNIAFFGENSYGIETAAQTYFDKNASQLSLAESAMLVGLLRAPTQYDPFLNPEAARDRRNQVLQNLVSVGDLSQEAADRYKATPISLATTAPPQVKEGCANAETTIPNVGFFCDYAVGWMLDHKVVTEGQLQQGGMKIVTTLDPALQTSLQRNLVKNLSPKAAMSAIMPVVDPHTGNVLAMASSKQYGGGANDTTTLPIFTSYTAQGASTYKLFPLLTALSAGVPANWELQTPSASTTYQWQVCSQDNGNVTNSDANESFNPGGNDTLADATAKSSNTFYTGIADQLFGCVLQPIINTANKLGMNALSRSNGSTGDDRSLTVAQSILRYSSAKRLVLGDIETSPLELTAAYAAVANDGKYNAPAPILSITDNKGNSISVPRSPSVQAVAPQVARQAVAILAGDTKSPGTSAGAFASWYATNKSIVAGKTGTAPGIDQKTHKDDKNGALWFVGMTPNYVATTAVINLDNPSWPASDLPGVKDAKDNAFGAYAAGLWAKAMRATLASKHWIWPKPAAVNGESVPNLTGMSLDEARSTLKSKGYKMQQLDATDLLTCASTVPLNNVAFYAPQVAPKGSTITVCPSSATPQKIYTPPPPPKPKPHSSSKPKPTSAHSGGSGGGNGRGGGGGNGPGGGGRGGGPHR